MKRRIIQTGKGSKSKARAEPVKVLPEDQNALDSRVAWIQLLIPLGLQAVAEELQAEVARLVGARYRREQAEQKRWGSNPGSVFLGVQKVAMRVPRVPGGGVATRSAAGSVPGVTKSPCHRGPGAGASD